MNRNSIFFLIIVIALVGAGYFIFIQKTSNINRPSEITTSPKSDGLLIARNNEAGFELQHPSIFEFEDKGEVTPAPQLYYNHWIIIRTQGQEFPELLIVLIYNNVNQNLNEFAKSHIFPNDTTPKNSVVGSKQVMESLHVGLDGETKNYFWLDSVKKRGVIFKINPAKAENLSDFHKIIESFKFSK